MVFFRRINPTEDIKMAYLYNESLFIYYYSNAFKRGHNIEIKI